MLSKTKLSNGITVASDYTNEIDSVSINISMKVGSRNETTTNNGISHFIEHMLFKGTEKRTAKEISNAFEDIGAISNAYTSKENTCYYAKVLNEYSEKCFEILADILQNPTFDETETERERNVILQELAMSKDTPDDIITDYYNETAFSKQAYGMPIIGSEKNIKSFTKNDFIKYRKENYVGKNLFITSTGNLTHEKLLEYIDKYITKIDNKNIEDIQKAEYVGGYFFKKKKLEQVQCLIGFKGFSYVDDNYYKNYIFNHILGGSMSSRLFQEIREKQGLCYTIYSSNTPTYETGSFDIYTAIEPTNIEKTILAIIKEIKNFEKHPIAKEEFERAKIKIKSSILMQFENIGYRSSNLLHNIMIKDKLPSKKEIIEKIENTKIEDLIEILESIINSKPTLAIYGNVEEKNYYDLLLDSLK